MRPVFVVEGKSDVNRLQKFIDADFVTTNGSALDKNTIEYLKELSKNRTIVIFTDPDYQGNKIRTKLEQAIPNALNAYVRKEYASNGKKLGVCETTDEEIIKALHELDFKGIKAKENNKEDNITMLDLMALNLASSNKAQARRDYIATFLPLGKTNSKTFLKRINNLHITLTILKTYLENYHDC